MGEGLVSLKETDDRPPTRLAHCQRYEMLPILGSSRQPSSRSGHVMRRCVRDAEWWLLVYMLLTFLEAEGLRALVTLDGPQDAGRAPGGGHTRDTCRFGSLQFAIVSIQNGLV
jgi:hypothetical protein